MSFNDEPIWWQDCVEINDCSKCPWSEKNEDGLKRCEEND